MLSHTGSIKVVLLGESGTGKTSLINRYIHDKFSQIAVPTVGASFHNKVISYEGTEIDLALWDTAGQESYRGLTPMYYRNAAVAIVVFDVMAGDSFSRVDSWLNEIKEECHDSIVIVLCGNKCDCMDERTVSLQEAEEFARLRDLPYCETSALTGVGVDFLFQTVVKSIYEINPSLLEPVQPQEDDSVNIAQKKVGSKCC